MSKTFKQRFWNNSTHLTRFTLYNIIICSKVLMWSKSILESLWGSFWIWLSQWETTLQDGCQQGVHFILVFRVHRLASPRAVVVQCMWNMALALGLSTHYRSIGLVLSMLNICSKCSNRNAHNGSLLRYNVDCRYIEVICLENTPNKHAMYSQSSCVMV